VDGGIGLATVGEDPRADMTRLVALARQAAWQATMSLSAEPQERGARRVRR
jgi:hypothetical protein